MIMFNPELNILEVVGENTYKSSNQAIINNNVRLIMSHFQDSYPREGYRFREP